ncbi:MAG: hypothetical protein QXZ43_04545 [Candidatus Aenigmatarchaeota archaeon]
MANPLFIILEMLYFLIKSLIDAILFISLKTIEFFASIAGNATLSIENMIIGVFVSGLVLFLVVKYLFGVSKELLIIMIIYFVLLLIAIIYRSVT